MAFEFKQLIVPFLVLIVLLSPNALCYIEEKQVGNNDITTKNTLGETCFRGKCSEREICNEIYRCECRPGFINRSNVCVSRGGENDLCTKNEDCCEWLVCIKGICRNATRNGEFITLAKICLGITITSIIIALLSSLLKCLMRYDSFQRFRRCDDSQSRNSNDAQSRNFFEPHPNVVHDEKPPSYEECIRSGSTNPLAEPPPPYVISSNDLTASKQIDVFLVRNVTEITPPVNPTAPLNAQSLAQRQSSEDPPIHKNMATQSS